MEGKMQSDSIAALAAALAQAQAAFEPIERTREVTVRSDKGNYTFAYAPLDVVLAATVKALSTNGLSITSQMMGDTLRTTLMHASGEWLASEAPLPRTDRPQQLGSAITYMRRYAIVSMLGVASEEDDDANAAEGNHVAAKQDRPPKPRAPDLTAQRTELSTLLGKLKVGAELADKAANKVERQKVIGRQWVLWCAGVVKRDLDGPEDMTADELERCLVTARAQVAALPKEAA